MTFATENFGKIEQQPNMDLVFQVKVGIPPTPDSPLDSRSILINSQNLD